MKKKVQREGTDLIEKAINQPLSMVRYFSHFLHDILLYCAKWYLFSPSLPQITLIFVI